ncbi:MAG TPA: competence/damage-inducible protein A [Gemmataceae bacterium]|nr:competence/damage-inducible protein A [Gemmataceae bacterium]
MKCEIISIGSELTSGQNLDTNCQWLSRRLAEMGIAVGWHTTIADDLDANIEAFRIATRRAGLVLATGGLGPTQDDLTREVLARVAGVALIEHAESLRQIEDMFQRRKRTMPERNRVQALFPAGAEPILNDCGTAPGVWMQIGDCYLAAMPGVPSEMFAMFETRVRPRLLALGLSSGVLVQRKINTFGTGESSVEEKLLDLTRRGHVPEVGITVSDAIISLRILAHAPTRTEAQAQIGPVEQTIRERLGDLVFGVEEEELQDAVAVLLAAKRRSIATAESVTAGLVAQRLSSVPGISAWLRGGIVAYDNRVKVELLGVPQALIDAHGAVSAEVAEAMAVGCRTRLQTDLAVSTVGLAGPASAGADKPVGLVYVGLAWGGGVSSLQFSWFGTRAEIQRRTAKLALNRVRLHLLGQT